MKLWTFQEAETQVRQELDIQGDDNFIENDEMVGYFNSAVDEMEKEILQMNEDYLLTSTPITFVQGQTDISLPTDIWGQKIRSFIYQNGTKIYPIKRFRDPEKFYKKAEMDYYATGETEYAYILKSVSEAQDKIVLTPAAQESGAVATLWYIRNAKRIPKVGESSATRATQLACIIDLPEAMDFIMQFVRVRCLGKDKNFAVPPQEIAILGELKADAVSALSERTPDNDTQVPMDVSFYEEMN